MMTHMQTNEKICSPVNAVVGFMIDDQYPGREETLLEDASGPLCSGHESSEVLAEENVSSRVMSEMPLWPSLKDIRSTMDGESPRKMGVRQALNYRSILITTALLSITAFGLMLSF